MNVEEDLLPINPISRPGTKLNKIEYVILHSFENSYKDSADNNFKSIKKAEGSSTSVHYIIGLNGEIVKIIPEDELSYHSGNKSINRKSIGIECTCKDVTEKFSNNVYDSMIKLLVDILKRNKLNPLTDIKRHYDITGKSCPKYYVDNPLEFEKIKKDVQNRFNNNYYLTNKCEVFK